MKVAKYDVSTYNEEGIWKSKVEGSARAAHTGGTKRSKPLWEEDVAAAQGRAHHQELDRTTGEKSSYGNGPKKPKG